MQLTFPQARDYQLISTKGAFQDPEASWYVCAGTGTVGRGRTQAALQLVAAQGLLCLPTMPI